METFDSRMITMRSEDGGTTSPAPPVTPPDHQHPEKPEPQPPSCMTCEGKRQLLHKIRVCVFATTEAQLFMDTHPDDKAAIAFYKHHKESLDALLKEWENCSGEVFDGSRWAMIDTPWPWQSRL